MIIEILLGLAATAWAVSNSNAANENVRQINYFNADTKHYINSALETFKEHSSNLSDKLKTTVQLRRNVSIGFIESFVYYLQHINSNITNKPFFDEEIVKLQESIYSYQNSIDNLVSKKLDENAMLVSAAAGTLVAGASSLGISALGSSLSVGLGITFFGVTSLIVSAIQLSKTQDALEEAKYLNANKYTLKNELIYKTKIIDTIYTLFSNYNRMISDLTNVFKDDFYRIREIYKKMIISSNENMKLIAKGEQPVFNFEDLSEEDQKLIYVCVEKSKVIAEFARAKLLSEDGSINYFEVDKLGVKYE